MTTQPADIRRLRTLSEENDILRERLRQLQDVLVPEYRMPRRWQLSRLEDRLLRALLKSGASLLSREAAFAALYPDPDEDPDVNSFDVYVCKLRRKFRKVEAPVVIETFIGEGYRLTAASVAYITAAIADDHAAYEAASHRSAA